MKVQNKLRELKYIDSVIGKKTAYHVFSSTEGYVLFTVGRNQNSGNY